MARRGSEAAVDGAGRPLFADYVTAQGLRLTRLAFLVTHDWEDARDAVQEAFVSLLRRWSQLPEGDRLNAYVTRSVVHAALAQAKQQQRSTPTPLTADFFSSLAQSAPVDATDSVLLWRLCSGLRPVQRAALTLRFYEDLPFADIARLLGCTESTARSHVRRAVVALRQGMEEGGSR